MVHIGHTRKRVLRREKWTSRRRETGNYNVLEGKEAREGDDICWEIVSCSIFFLRWIISAFTSIRERGNKVDFWFF